MAKAKFTGRPVPRPGSRRYRSLPEWLLKELGNEAPAGSPRRIRDPKHGDGLTVVEAAERLGCKPFSMFMLFRGAWKKRGVPDLGGEKLKTWDEYILEPGERGRLLRVPVCSARQVERIDTARESRKLALAGRKWLTDVDVMRRHPKVFARRAVRMLNKPVSKMTDAELHRYRPACLSSWRKEETGCPYLPGGREINSRNEAGRILNDPRDIDSIAEAITAVSADEWTDPKSKIVYVPTRAAEDEFGVPEQVLTACSRRRSTFLPGDGLFHPMRRKRRQRWWPRSEVQAYATGQKERRGRRAEAEGWLRKLLAIGAMYSADVFRKAKEDGYAPGMIYAVRSRAGVCIKTVGKPGTAEPRSVWYMAGTDPAKLQSCEASAVPPADTGHDNNLGQEAARTAAEVPRPRRQGGRPESSLTQELHRFCYEEYRVKKKYRAQVWLDARRRFDRPRMQESDVTIYANRYAAAKGLPRIPEDTRN